MTSGIVLLKYSRLLLSALLALALAWAAQARAVDTYDPLSRRLTIPSLTIGAATYVDLAVVVSRVVSGPSGTAAKGNADSYDPGTGELTIQEVTLGSSTYYNVVVAIEYLVSIGGIRGADRYSNGVLSVPTLQQGNMLYNLVTMSVTPNSVVGISGGMPAVIRDQFDPARNTLIIPAVQVGNAVYTNVSLSANDSNIKSVGSKSTIVSESGTALIMGSTAVSEVTTPNGGPAPLDVAFSITHPPLGGIYYGYSAIGGAVTGVTFWFDPSLQPDGSQNGSAQMQFDQPQFQGSGTHISTVTLMICLDSQCKISIAGSPQTIAVSYTVSGDAVPQGIWSVLPNTLNFESPSNGPPLTATLNLTGGDLPPYGAYLFLKQSNGGFIQDASFFITSESISTLQSTVTLDLAPPATLGVGIFSDTLTAEICYDPLCAHQATGSPWNIPISYAVTGTDGIDFQARVLRILANALATDPSGMNLYVGTGREYGNQIPSNLFKIDPVSGATLASVALPAPAQQIAISPDGSYAYVSVNTPSDQLAQIERIDLSTMTIDLEIPITQLWPFVTDLSVSPVSAHTIGVAFSYNGPPNTGTAFRDLEVFDDGVVRPDALTQPYSDGPTHGYFQWNTDGATIDIEGSTSNNYGAIFRSAVSPAGLAPATTLIQSGSSFAGIAGRLHALNGRLYSDGGAVIDQSNGSLLGVLELQTPISYTNNNVRSFYNNILPDASTGKAFAAYEDSVSTGSSHTLQAFSLTTLNPLWIVRSPVALSSPVRWGANGLAFLGLEDPSNMQYYVYLANGSIIAPALGASTFLRRGALSASPDSKVASFLIRPSR